MDKKDVKVDLRINRRESGLSNDDLAHLLAVSSDRVSRLQTGRGTLSVYEVFLLSLIFDKSLDNLFITSTGNAITALKERLANMPNEPVDWRAHDNRLNTLNRLTQRLQALTQLNHDN